MADEVKDTKNEPTSTEVENEEDVEITTSEELEEEKEETSSDKDEEEEEEEEDHSSEEDDDFAEEDLPKAKELFKLLRNKETATPFLVALATQAGLKVETPQQVVQTKKELRDLVKEELGEEYSLLADKLGPLLEKVVGNIKADQARLQQDIEAKSTEQKVDAAFKLLNKETNGDFGKYEKKISELMDDMPIGPKTDTVVYLRRLYKLASEEDKERKLTKKVAAQINKNARSVSRISSSGAGEERVSSTPAGPVSVSEAVSRAFSKLKSKG